MELDDRRPDRPKRESSRNASNDIGGNEKPRKPDMGIEEDSMPRQPKMKPKKPAPVEHEYGKMPEKRPPKVKRISVPVEKERDVLKSLKDFNDVVNQIVDAELKIIEDLGGFSAVNELADREKNDSKKEEEKDDG